MDNKDKNESSTPNVPKFSSGKEKSQKPRHKKKSKGEKMVAVLSSYTSSTEEIKIHIFTTGLTMNKNFLLSREKFLGYATTKFGNDIPFSMSEQRVAQMYMLVPTAIDHTRELVYDKRQNEIEAKEFRAEFRKLQNDLGKLYGILKDQCDSGMKNNIQ